MDYPLAEAILGYAAGDALDERVVGQHHEYRRHVMRRDGASFAAELERLLRLYDSAVTAAMLNLLGSHDAPRMRTVLGDSIAAVRIATLLQMTLPGAPCVYYGDEVGMRGEQDPLNRGAFPWDRSTWDGELRTFVRELIGLRKRHAALRDGELAVLGTADGAFAMARRAAGERFVVATNPDPVERHLRIALPDHWGPIGGVEALDLGGRPTPGGHDLDDGRIRLVLAPRSGLIVRID
jgi:neopullulanase